MRQHPRIRRGVLGRNGSAGISQPDAVKQAVAHVASDADDHPSGLTVARTASQILYQTAAIRKLEIQGSSFCQGPSLTFQPPLTDGVDYSITRATSEKLSLTLKSHKKWRYEAGPLYLTSVSYTHLRAHETREDRV